MTALITPQQTADYFEAKGRALGEDWDDSDLDACRRCEMPTAADDLADLDGIPHCQPCINAEVGSGPERPRDL